MTITEEEARRRSEYAQALQEARTGGVARALAAERARTSNAANNDAVIAGLINGFLFNWGDELFGRDWFEGARRGNQGAYDAAQGLANVASPIGTLLGRVPLAGRLRQYESAAEDLAREGVRQRRIPMPSRSVNPMDYIPGFDPRTRQQWPDIPDAMGSRASLRPSRIAEAEDVLASRRQALDDVAGGLAVGHGALIGSGGWAPEDDLSLEERLLGGTLGAGASYGLLRGAGELQDLSGYALRPLQGKSPGRFSSQDVLDLPGQSGPTRDVSGVLRQIRMAEEAAARDRTGDMRFGRAAEPVSDARAQRTTISPMMDESPMVRGMLGAAARSPGGAEMMQGMDDRLASATAQERIGQMRGPQMPQGQSAPTLSPNQQQLPNAALNDPMSRPHINEMVMGSRQWAKPEYGAMRLPNGQGGFDDTPSLRSPMQEAKFERPFTPGAQTFPAMSPTQKSEMANLLLQRLSQEAQNMQGLPLPQQALKARELLAALDDRNIKVLFAEIGLREGAQSPALTQMLAFRDGLQKIATNRMSADDMLANMRGASGDVLDPAMQEAAMQLRDVPMGKRLAEALLDERRLNQADDVFHLNPADSNPGEALFALRRESQRPPRPYAAPAGWRTELAATGAASGLDYLLHEQLLK